MAASVGIEATRTAVDAAAAEQREVPAEGVEVPAAAKPKKAKKLSKRELRLQAKAAMLGACHILIKHTG